VNLLEQQASNRRRTWVVMGVFIAFLLFLGIGFDSFVVGNGGGVPIGTPIALLVGFGSSWASMRLGDKMVLASASAIPLDEAIASATDDEKLRYHQFDNVVEEMAIAAGLPKPAVYVIPDSDPNAFATGRDPNHASLAATKGLLFALNREELQGVVAHEMSHIRNYDIRLMMIVAALVGAAALLSDWAGRGMQFGAFSGRSRRDRDDRDGGGGLGSLIFFVVWIVAVILAPIVGRLLALWLSRTREYQADATGAALTRNPLGLASALEKIENAVEPTSSIKRGTAHLCIADPMGKLADDSGSANLWATHPPMAKRIEALRQMAYQQ
jgi:heat shock protein HtpX